MSTYGKRSRAVCVDLVDRHRQLRAGFHLCDLLDGQGVLRVLANVDVALQLGSPALVDDVGRDLGVADQRGVLLAGVDGGTVPGEGVDDWGPDGVGK